MRPRAAFAGATSEALGGLCNSYMTVLYRLDDADRKSQAIQAKGFFAAGAMTCAVINLPG
jgi:hypothetical protein